MRNEIQLLEEANKLKLRGTRILGIGSLEVVFILVKFCYIIRLTLSLLAATFVIS